MDKSATSTYAKIIISLCGFIVLGLIASDRQHAAAVRMRQELVERRIHAQEMLERINSLRKGADLFLVNLCYAKLDGTGVVLGSGEHLLVVAAGPAQTGLLGNYKVEYGGYDASQPNEELAKLRRLVVEIKKVVGTANESETLRPELKRAITSEINKASRHLPEPQIDELVDAVLRSTGTVLSDEQVSWIVTGTVRQIDLDHESRGASRFGLGYVEEFGAVNDLPVFSAYEFVGLRPDDVYKRIKDYQTTIEKTLLSKTETENSVQVFGSGVSLNLSDLVIFAGPLIALFQLLYLIALRREIEGKGHGSHKDQTSFSVPRFSSPVDPLRRHWPSSPELSLERVLYSAFLVIPSAILLFGWLTRFRIDILRGFTASAWGPFQTFFLSNIIDSETRGFFAPAIYVVAIGASCYALHRMVAVPGGQAKPRWSRPVSIFLACVTTAIVALAIAVRQRREEFYVGAAVYGACAVCAFVWEKKPKFRRPLMWLAVTLLLAAVILTIVAVSFRMDFAPLIPKLWVPLGFLLPSGKNVALVVWILAASLLASIRCRHRLPTVFFSFAVCLTIICILW